MSGREKLRSLLFSEERTLENIKFWPGNDRGLSEDKLCAEAADAIESALAKGDVDEPPMTTIQKAAF